MVRPERFENGCAVGGRLADRSGPAVSAGQFRHSNLFSDWKVLACAPDPGWPRPAPETTGQPRCRPGADFGDGPGRPKSQRDIRPVRLRYAPREALQTAEPQARRETAKARNDTSMENLPGTIAVLLPVLALLMPITIVWIVFWYKARQRELELQENLRLREFEHLQRLKELELEIEKARARDPRSRPEQPRTERTPRMISTERLR